MKAGYILSFYAACVILVCSNLLFGLAVRHLDMDQHCMWTCPCPAPHSSNRVVSFLPQVGLGLYNLTAQPLLCACHYEDGRYSLMIVFV